MSSVSMKYEKLSIPTYEPAAPNTLPFFLEKKAYQGATGRVYPIPYTDCLSNEANPKDYDAVILENEFIEVVLLPEIGGKIHGARDKGNGYEFIYQNTVIKPAMVGLAGPWVSGGVEFNWPQHHRPTTYMPAEATLIENGDSKTCWMGEVEPFHRMRGMVGVTVYAGKSYVEVKAVVYNRTSAPLPFLWWNNLAVRVNSRYKAVFPPDVEFVNDHDRRAVISFPEMKGIYDTARPYNYGDGVDGTWFSNIKLPTSVMVMRGQSDSDFLGGYDFNAGAGTIHVADHNVSVGKKMWTWGDGPFGNAWQANLTDNGDRYIELMTGCFSDNQPDFTYIMPGETKAFNQYWYPIRNIGEVKNATLEGALALDIKNGKARISAITTSEQKGCRLSLILKGKTHWEQTVDLSPVSDFEVEIALPDGTEEKSLQLQLVNADGKQLVAYKPVERGIKPAPKAREIAPEPMDIATVEELYLNGAHLEQYKHHTYEPEPYYMEALRRDPGDLRCNHALGRLLMEKGDFAGARRHLEKAVERLKLRNDNPPDTEPLYTLACLERLTGNIDRAYDLYQAAAWQYAWRSAAYYEIACIDCIRSETDRAVEYLEKAMETNTRHYKARTLAAWLKRDILSLEDILSEVPQDAWTRFVLYLLKGRQMETFVLSRAEDCIDVALDFLHAGFKADAVNVLDCCACQTPMVAYHKAYILGRPELLQEAANLKLDYCFPNRLEDIAPLQWAYSEGNDAKAAYLAGCIYYDRMNYEAAIAQWESARTADPGFAFTHRNLAQAYFDHRNDPASARISLEKALELAPDNARILYELLQLYKNINVSVKERIALLEAHADLVPRRDDCYLEWIILYTQDGQYQRAHELLGARRFNIYEGGEGKLTRHHGWLYTLMGRQSHLAGNLEEALRLYGNALVYPVNYGEGRHYSSQEANIYYYMSLVQEELGMDAEEALQMAANQPEQITEISYFAAKAMEKQGQTARAREVYEAMVGEGKKQIAGAHLHGYFGVGMAAPLPFELDISRMNCINAYLLIALGTKGLGYIRNAQEAVRYIEKLDPTNFKLDFIRKLQEL